MAAASTTAARRASPTAPSAATSPLPTAAAASPPSPTSFPSALPRPPVQRGGHWAPGAWAAGDKITASGPVLGTVLFPALHGRLGFSGSNLAGNPIQYINAQIGGVSFVARAPLTLDCPDQCAGS